MSVRSDMGFNNFYSVHCKVRNESLKRKEMVINFNKLK